nr:hypothetical protein [Symmachiella dynata]
MLEWVSADQAAIDGILTKLLCNATRPPHRVVREAQQQLAPEVLRFARCDCANVPVSPEECDKMFLRTSPYRGC